MSADAPVNVFFNRDFVDLITAMPYWHTSCALTFIVPKTFIIDGFIKSYEEIEYKVYTTIKTGSLAEGLQIPASFKRINMETPCSTIDNQDKLGHPVGDMVASSDTDIMACVNGITVGDCSGNTMILGTEGVHPGYTLLKVEDKTSLAIFLSKATDKPYSCMANSGELDFATKSGLYLRNKLPILYKLRIGNNAKLFAGDTFYSQGPAATFTSESRKTDVQVMGLDFSHLRIDGVLCFSCPEWPSVAAEWICRLRPANWPSKEQISLIHGEGCHVVPVGHHLSTTFDVEWRFSFSVAEVMLARSLTAEQKQSYLIFKIACSTYLKEYPFIATYHLKTLFFWACEKIPPCYWRNDTLFSNVLYLIDSLKLSLMKHRIANFFIPENNMIDHVPKNVVSHAAKSVFKLRHHIVDILNAYFRNQSIDWSHVFTTDTQRIFVALTNKRQYNQSNEELAVHFALEVALSVAKFYADGFEREVRETLAIYLCIQVYINYHHRDVYRSLEVHLPNKDPILQKYPDDMICIGQWILDKLFPPEETSIQQKNFKALVLLKLAEFCARRTVAARSEDENTAFLSKARTYFQKSIQYTRETPDISELPFLCKYSMFLYQTGHHQECVEILNDILLKHQLHVDTHASSDARQLYNQYELVQFSLFSGDVGLLDSTLKMLFLIGEQNTVTEPCFWLAVYLLVRCYTDTQQEQKAKDVLDSFQLCYRDFEPYQMGSSYLAILSFSYFHLRDYSRTYYIITQIERYFSADTIGAFCRKMEGAIIAKQITE